MTPKQILIKEGCIVDIRGGLLRQYFSNCCGHFLKSDGLDSLINLEDYDDDLISIDGNRNLDIMNVYNFNNYSYFYMEDFSRILSMQKEGYLQNNPIKLIFSRNNESITPKKRICKLNGVLPKNKSFVLAVFENVSNIFKVYYDEDFYFEDKKTLVPYKVINWWDKN